MFLSIHSVYLNLRIKTLLILYRFKDFTIVFIKDLSLMMYRLNLERLLYYKEPIIQYFFLAILIGQSFFSLIYYNLITLIIYL